MKYKVVCKGMFVAGNLYRQGETFEIDEENAERMRLRSPHLTFEAVDDEAKRADTIRRGREVDSEATARLPQRSGEGKKPAKRGAGRVRKGK